MDRRAFLLHASAYALPIPTGDSMHFRVLRNGSAVGDHYIRFNSQGDSLSVSISVTGKVTFAGIPVFSYTMNATEIWQGGVFQNVHSVADKNGTTLEVEAERIAGGYSVQGTTVPRYVAPLNLLPLTYWNKAMLDGTILNLSTGHSYPVTTSSPGWNLLPTATGGTLTAQRFDVTGKLHMSVWYDKDNIWSGLEFQRDGDFSYQKYV